MYLNAFLEIGYSSKKPTYSNTCMVFITIVLPELCIYHAFFFFSYYLVFPLKDPHNLNVDVLALFLNSKCFHVLVMANPFFLNASLLPGNISKQKMYLHCTCGLRFKQKTQFCTTA